MELFKHTASQLHGKLVAKEISAVELTKAVLGRVDAVDKDVQAYITRTSETALAQAQAVDSKIQRGEKVSVLAGILSVNKLIFFNSSDGNFNFFILALPDNTFFGNNVT